MPIIIPALVILVVLGLTVLALGYWISSLLLYAQRQPVTRTPGDYGLEYEEISFHSSDGLTLRGWWIPARRAPQPVRQDRAVILLHPMFGNRHGFSARHQGWPRLFRAELEVDLLKTARGFHQADYAVMLFDFRSHGESQHGLGAGGLTEDQDVVGAVDYVFRRLMVKPPELETPPVGVVGFGLGAAAAIAAVGREKGSAEKTRIFTGDSEGGVGWTELLPPNVKRLRFVVAVQPASLGRLVEGYLRTLSVPLRGALVSLVDWLCRWRGGYPLNGASLLKFVREVHVPILYIQARTDQWAGGSEVQALFDATPGPKQIWWINEILERLQTYDYVGHHLERILAFAAQQVSPD